MSDSQTKRGLVQILSSLRDCGVSHLPFDINQLNEIVKSGNSLASAGSAPQNAPKPNVRPSRGAENLDSPVGKSAVQLSESNHSPSSDTHRAGNSSRKNSPQPTDPTPTANPKPTAAPQTTPTFDPIFSKPSLPLEERLVALKTLSTKVAACKLCPSLCNSRTQTVFGVGNAQPRLVFLGEAPGADEDRLGEPFVGKAGQLLNDIIEKGMKIKREEVYILNILKCRPPGNRNPEEQEAKDCRPFLDQQLEILRPDYICCLGGIAATNLLGLRLSVGMLRGRFHDYHGVKVLATYHPSYLLRNPNAKKMVWEDIQMLMREMELD